VYWSGQYAATTIATVQTAPTLATGANGITVIALLTTDGGTKWRGWVEATIAGGSTGSLYSWGSNLYGQLGQNDTFTLYSPVQVGALTNWASVSAGNKFCAAVKTDGTLWTWGLGGNGQLGQNSIPVTSSPIQVGSLTNWRSVAAGNFFSCVAIKTDGTLWSWGFGGVGQLGQNSTASISSPKQVGALTNWASVSNGDGLCVAIKTDGTLWTWGSGDAGRLGQNSTAYLSSPAQVGALTNWASAWGYNFAIAVKTDGTLWSWGFNNVGQLGQNNTTTTSSPVQVGALTSWASVSAGNVMGAAIKTDGTLWTWGYGTQGRLGQNNTTAKSSPVQVGALTNWSKVSVSASGTFCTAIKTDGTLWSWGSGASGRLGQGSTTYRSSPVQVGALTTWGLTSAGNNSGTALIVSTANPA
jgi:alpha-tubulin suppressor-like RCC1 family protein